MVCRHSVTRCWLLAACLVCALLSPRVAAADDDSTRPASFALIIGSNRSVDEGVPPLKYADDDAARYLDLFRLLGARTYLLTTLDDNTRRLHPQAAAEALEPRAAPLERTVAALAVDVARARDRHVETTLYFVYAGHGNVDEDGEGYFALEDQRVTGADLARMVARIPATHVHVIVYACASYFLAYSRGPGGERRPVKGFQDSALLSSDPRVGLLLSTSSARESHEWDEFQAGVFSHEVRSGLYGAADADGDGRVSYREIAAFVSRANAAIPNERFRPDVHAKAPADSETLLDIRHGLSRHLDFDGAHAAHYWMEDELGVRLLDFHNAPGQRVRLVRPAPSGRVYLRRQDDDAEFTVPAWPDSIAFADLQPAAARVASRGAAHEAFSRLFALPFDDAAVEAYVEPPTHVAEDARASRPLSLRPVVGYGALALGVAGLGTGVAMSIAALTTSHGSTQASVSASNARIANENTFAAVAYTGGAIVAVSGLAVLLWPQASHVQIAAAPTGGFVGYSTRF